MFSNSPERWLTRDAWNDSRAGSQGLRQLGKMGSTTCLFLDIGGVLLTDGWDRHARKRAATHFRLDWAEMEDRHQLTWNTYQLGKFSLQEYLSRAIFYKGRPFTRAQFRRYMFAQSKPYSAMIDLVSRLKTRHGLKIAVLSNEGRELNAHRIRKFKLDGFVDFFVSSCFVQLLKPDPDIFLLALDVAQVPAQKVIYLENTPMFTQVAEDLGIRSILHTDYESTRAKFAAFGLRDDKGGIRAIG